MHITQSAQAGRRCSVSGATCWIIMPIFAAVFALAADVHAAPSPSAAPSDRPNVVFILADDLGWADLPAYGNEFTEAPHLDRLAAQGMRFTDAYAASPVCSSTRASLMTGRHSARVRITDFISGHWRPWERLIVPKLYVQLPRREVTIGEVMQAAGYRTGYFGKWHLGGKGYLPDVQGFDVSSVKPLPPGPLTEQGMKFIEQHLERRADAPFFLFLSHPWVHIPLRAEPAMLKKYEAKFAGKDGGPHPAYAAMIEALDESVGTLMAKLDERKLAENTIVIFFSDNGGLIQRFDGDGPVVTSNKPLRAEKGTVYEGGIRVPCIVRWPGVVKAGSTSDAVVVSHDFLPTLASAASARLPDDLILDGEDLTPVLKQSGELQRDAIYFHYPHYHHMDPAGAMREGEWKLIEHFDDGELELYNLKRDLGEQHNLAEEMPDRAKAMRAKLAAWRKNVAALMPTENPNHDPSRAHLWGERGKRPPVALELKE